MYEQVFGLCINNWVEKSFMIPCYLSIIASLYQIFIYLKYPSSRQHPNYIMIYRAVFDCIICFNFLISENTDITGESCDTFIGGLLSCISETCFIGAELSCLFIAIDLYQQVYNPFVDPHLFSKKLSLWMVLSSVVFGLLMSCYSGWHGRHDTGLCWIKTNRYEPVLNYKSMLFFYGPTIFIYIITAIMHFFVCKGLKNLPLLYIDDTLKDKLLNHRINSINRGVKYSIYFPLYWICIGLTYLVLDGLTLQTYYTNPSSHISTIIGCMLYLLMCSRGLLTLVLFLTTTYEHSAESNKPKPLLKTMKSFIRYSKKLKENEESMPSNTYLNELQTDLRAQLMACFRKGVRRIYRHDKTNLYLPSQNDYEFQHEEILFIRLEPKPNKDIKKNNSNSISTSSTHNLTFIGSIRNFFGHTASPNDSMNTLHTNTSHIGSSNHLNTLHTNTSHIGSSNHLNTDVSIINSNQVNPLHSHNTLLHNQTSDTSNQSISTVSDSSQLNINNSFYIPLNNSNENNDKSVMMINSYVLNNKQSKEDMNESPASMSHSSSTTLLNAIPTAIKVNSTNSTLNERSESNIHLNTIANKLENSIISNTESFFYNNILFNGNRSLKFHEYSPYVFHFIRHMYNINEEEYITEIQRLVDEIHGDGASNSFFFHTSNNLFLIKTISKDEFMALQDILPQYVEHLLYCREKGFDDQTEYMNKKKSENSSLFSTPCEQESSSKETSFFTDRHTINNSEKHIIKEKINVSNSSMSSSNDSIRNEIKYNNNINNNNNSNNNNNNNSSLSVSYTNMNIESPSLSKYKSSSISRCPDPVPEEEEDYDIENYNNTENNNTDNNININNQNHSKHTSRDISLVLQDNKLSSSQSTLDLIGYNSYALRNDSKIDLIVSDSACMNGRDSSMSEQQTKLGLVIESTTRTQCSNTQKYVSSNQSDISCSDLHNQVNELASHVYIQDDSHLFSHQINASQESLVHEISSDNDLASMSPHSIIQEEEMNKDELHTKNHNTLRPFSPSSNLHSNVASSIYSLHPSNGPVEDVICHNNNNNNNNLSNMNCNSTQDNNNNNNNNNANSITSLYDISKDPICTSSESDQIHITASPNTLTLSEYQELSESTEDTPLEGLDLSMKSTFLSEKQRASDDYDIYLNEINENVTNDSTLVGPQSPYSSTRNSVSNTTYPQSPSLSPSLSKQNSNSSCTISSTMNGIPKVSSTVSTQSNYSQNTNHSQKHMIDINTNLAGSSYSLSNSSLYSNNFRPESANGSFYIHIEDQKEKYDYSHRFIRENLDSNEKEFISRTQAYFEGSYLCRYYGLYSLDLFNKEYYIVVMNNIFPPSGITERYDLKGSYIDRNHRVLKKGDRIKCSVCEQLYVEGLNERCSKRQNSYHIPSLVFKDNDLKYNLVLYDSEGDRVSNQLYCDIDFLANNNIMDYSLLIGVKKIQQVRQTDQTFRVSNQRQTYAQVTRKINKLKLKYDDALKCCDTLENAPHGIHPAIYESAGSYYIGIIDMLSKYTWSRYMERIMKCSIHLKDRNGLSVMAPAPYRDRFKTRVVDKIIYKMSKEERDTIASQNDPYNIIFH